jgi:hypothetical protein
LEYKTIAGCFGKRKYRLNEFFKLKYPDLSLCIDLYAAWLRWRSGRERGMAI